IVQRTLIRPPSSRMGTITEAERQTVIAASPIGTVYDVTIDRQSAFEMLKAKVEEKVAEAPAGPPPDVPGEGSGSLLEEILGLNVPRNKRLSTTQKAAREVTRDLSETVGGALAGSVGRQIFRSVLGGILRR
ncbi:MAG: helicase HerA-like domain-containing protein, partial [Bauldia litoralis]